MHKYLRIAVTALSLAAFVLLIFLWMRSYTHMDTFSWRLSNTRIGSLQSISGRIWFYPSVPTVPGYLGAIFGLKTGVVEERSTSNLPWYTRKLGIGFSWQRTFWAACLPHFFFVLIAAACAIGPWRRWRFSVRTLIIAMTLVAVGLGIIVASL